MWAARNIKYFPIGIVEAIKNEPILAEAKKIKITLPNKSIATLVNLSSWQLLNLNMDEIIALPKRISKTCNISIEVITKVLQKYNIQNTGILEMNSFLEEDINTPIIMTSSNIDYNW